MKSGDKVILKDRREATVESVTDHIVWLRDKHGNLSSADLKTGWSGDGNWINDIPAAELLGKEGK